MQAGGGTTQQMNGISCPSDGTCYAAGNAGTILKTDERRPDLVAADERDDAEPERHLVPSATRVRRGRRGAATARYTTDGSTWNAGTTGDDAGAERRLVPARPRRVSRSARPARSSLGRRRRDVDGADERHDERAERGHLPGVGRLLRGRRRRDDAQVVLERSTAAHLDGADEQHDAGAERRRVRRTPATASPTAAIGTTLVDHRRRHDLDAAGQPDQRADDGAQRDEHRAERRRLHSRRAASSASAPRATS